VITVKLLHDSSPTGLQESPPSFSWSIRGAGHGRGACGYDDPVIRGFLCISAGTVADPYVNVVIPKLVKGLFRL